MGLHNEDDVTDLAEYRRQREARADAAVLAVFSQITGRPMHLVNRTPEELVERRARALRRRAERAEWIRERLESSVPVYQNEDPDGMIGA